MVGKFERIYIEITNICNFSCPFCSSVARQPHSMTIDEFSNALQQVKPFTNEICLHVLGEPLLHPQLKEILQLCQATDIRVNLVTNGYHIATQLPTLIEFSGVFSKINFSIHSYIYHKQNISNKLISIIKSAIKLSNLGISIELRNLLGNSDIEFDSALMNALKQCANTKLIDTNSNQKIKDKMYYVVKKPFVWPDRSKLNVPHLNSKGKIYCLGGKSHIAILSDMTVIPCCLDTAAEITLGNLSNTTLDEILKSELFTSLCKTFKEGKPAHSLCATCQYARK